MKSILAIIISIFIVLALILTTVHLWGLGQTFVEFPNEFFKSEEKLFYVIPWEKTSSKKYILFANVRQNNQEQLMVSDDLSLIDFLNQRKDLRFILNLNDNKENIHQRMAKVLQETGSEKRVIIQSDFHILLTSLKELKPLLLYGTSHSDIMRTKTFQSAFILPAVPFKGDVYISPLVLKKIPVMDAEIMNEMRRRKKKVILGPLQNAEDFQKAKALAPDGYFLSEESLLN